MGKKKLNINREISWLGFNERVLQEAEDEHTPLIERFKFLGIFSNNADEYFRVRVASLRRLSKLNKRLRLTLDVDPEKTLQSIQEIVENHQIRFEHVFDSLVKEAKKQGIHLIDETQCTPRQQQEVSEYFREVVRTSLVPIMLDERREFPHLKDRAIYLAVKLSNGTEDEKVRYAVIEVPSKVLSRFMVLGSRGAKRYVMLLDDIIRIHLKDIFSIFDFEYAEAFTLKLTRDAELDVDDDLSMSVIDSLTKSLASRKSANPVRFVYDKSMPEDLKDFLFRKLKIKDGDSTNAGGRYHNFRDFMDFPAGMKNHHFKPLPPLRHPDIRKNRVLESIREKDILLNYPFHSFDPIIDLLRESAIDPNVKSIKINLYRVAKNSKIINSLINAAKNGKRVVVVIELRARFDEENNIYWSNKLKEEGITVLFGVPNLKVHSKLILISRRRKSRTVLYAHIGTGNFNEKTANLYTDTSLLTADKRITSEVDKVFDFFENNFLVKRYSHLIISPTGTRRKFVQLINHEIKQAKKGKEARIILKLNNLVDDKMIKKLYEASSAGVKVNLIIRGMCSLMPGVKGVSENITIISIIDRYLEHARILYFHAGGEEKIYLSSADWMGRNLDRRVEVSVPVYSPDLKETIKDLLTIQLSDNTKARRLGNQAMLNEYVRTSGRNIRSQLETYKYFQNKLNETDTEEKNK